MFLVIQPIRSLFSGVAVAVAIACLACALYFIGNGFYLVPWTWTKFISKGIQTSLHVLMQIIAFCNYFDWHNLPWYAARTLNGLRPSFIRSRNSCSKMTAGIFRKGLRWYSNISILSSKGRHSKSTAGQIPKIACMLGRRLSHEFVTMTTTNDLPSQSARSTSLYTKSELAAVSDKITIAWLHIERRGALSSRNSSLDWPSLSCLNTWGRPDVSVNKCEWIVIKSKWVIRWNNFEMESLWLFAASIQLNEKKRWRFRRQMSHNIEVLGKNIPKNGFQHPYLVNGYFGYFFGGAFLDRLKWEIIPHHPPFQICTQSQRNWCSIFFCLNSGGWRAGHIFSCTR